MVFLRASMTEFVLAPTHLELQHGWSCCMYPVAKKIVMNRRQFRNALKALKLLSPQFFGRDVLKKVVCLMGSHLHGGAHKWLRRCCVVFADG